MRDILEAAMVVAIGIFVGVPILAVLAGWFIRAFVWTLNYGFPIFRWAAHP